MDDANTVSPEVGVTDWSGERFEDADAVSRPDRIDPDPRSGEPGVSPAPQSGQPRPSPELAARNVPAESSASGYSPMPGVRRRHKRLLVSLAAAGAVLVALAVAVVVTLVDGRGGRAGGSAGDAAKSYLLALARGDAETALSYGIDQPATREFLTADILKKQVGQWPIRNIKVLHDNSGAPDAAMSMAHVHVVATFGGETSDAVLHLRLDRGRWKLDSAAIKFAPGLGASMGNAAAKTVTLFGKPIGDSAVYVFPGWIDIGTTNPYITVTVPPLLLDQLTMAAPYWTHPNFALSDRGRDAVSAQLAAAMANCRKSNLLAPPGCPVHLDLDGLAEGTAVWGTAELTAVKLDVFEPYRLTSTFSSQVIVPVTAKTSDGVTRQQEVTAFVSGTADMAQIPPALTFR